jgi:hypothetical protein
MPRSCQRYHMSELYPLQDAQQDHLGPAGPALNHLVNAWRALALLGDSLPEGPDRWQADSLFTAQEGIRHAWLAVSNLDRGLRRQGGAMTAADSG